jgi:hypothetical protein
MAFPTLQITEETFTRARTKATTGSLSEQATATANVIGNKIFTGTSSSRVRARRPLRGIQIKEDTYVSLKIVRADGSPILQIDASGPEDRDSIGLNASNTNFIVQSVSEAHVEKNQILETFGEPFLFFFGERPIIINVAGWLLNTVDFNWRTEWLTNYEESLRGTRLVEEGARAYLSWDDTVVEGYILQTAVQDDANEPYRIPFNFSMYVTKKFQFGVRGLMPIGHISPIKILSDGRKGAGPTDLAGLRTPFEKRVGTVVSTALKVINVASNPIREALRVVQGAIAKDVGNLFGAIEDKLRSPQEKDALRKLRGEFPIDAQGNTRKSLSGFGPLRNNYDEFLNTEFEKSSIISTFEQKGINDSNFVQRLLSFIPGLDNPRQLNKALKQGKSIYQAVKSKSLLTDDAIFTGETAGASFLDNFKSDNFRNTFSPYQKK